MEKPRSALSEKGTAYLLALLCCALWGSAFPAIKIGYRLLQIDSADTPSLVLFAGCRFLLAGLIGLLLLLVTGHSIKPKKEAASGILMIAFLQTVVQYFFFYVGLAHTSGVKASVLSASNVFFIILISACLFRQERLSAGKMIGCVFGFLGVLLVNLEGLELKFNLLGDGFMVISAIAYSLSSVLVKTYSAKEDPVVITAYQFLLGGAGLAAAGILSGGGFGAFPAAGAAILLYLACTASVTYSLWGLLLKHHPVSRIAPFDFFNPVVGVILSALLLKESIGLGWQIFAALALVSIGIVIVNRKVKE